MFTDKLENKQSVDLSPPEAALALVMMVGFTDDVITDEEAAAVRRYYRIDTAESLEKKLGDLGVGFPRQLPEMEAPVLEILKKEDKNFRLRAIATAQIIAQADGNTSHDEMAMIARFASALEVAPAEADRFAEERLLEIDEQGDYYRYRDGSGYVDFKADLSPGECALLVSTIIGFSDGELSENEAAVARDHFTEMTLGHLKEKFIAQELTYPEDAAKVAPEVLGLLADFSRQKQLYILAVALKTAQADGIKEEERTLLEGWCQELSIGLSEVEGYVQTLGAMA